MKVGLSEEEMRRALFGASEHSKVELSSHNLVEERSGSVGAKICVTLHVSNIFEGDFLEVKFYSSNLSRLVAEMDAKRKYQKKYRYVEIIAVVRT